MVQDSNTESEIRYCYTRCGNFKPFDIIATYSAVQHLKIIFKTEINDNIRLFLRILQRYMERWPKNKSSVA